MISTNGRYWWLEDCGETYPGEQRWLVFARTMHRDLQDRLSQGRVLDGWPNGVSLQCDPPHIFEDMPWLGEPFHVVSVRLRTFLERTYPETAQFLPVQMVDAITGEIIETPIYYIANWLRMADCVDFRRSVYKPNVYGSGRHLFSALIIDEQRARFPITRVMNAEINIIAHDNVRRAIRARGFTGVKFYPIWNSMDELPSPLPPFPLDFKSPC